MRWRLLRPTAAPFRLICRLPSAATALYHCAMPNYRRAFVPGGCWFFTANLLDRRRRLLTDHIDLLRQGQRCFRSSVTAAVVAT